MGNVRSVKQPVPYKHKSGAVIWVGLDQNARLELKDQLVELEKPKSPEFTDERAAHEASAEALAEADGCVPVARDGTRFCPKTCSRNGLFTVGEKGDEHRFRTYADALDYLRKMPTAKWRRPNPKGNWGIVSAVKWE